MESKMQKVNYSENNKLQLSVIQNDEEKVQMANPKQKTIS